jgi:lipoyl(octanoyl) transferase
MSRLKNVSDLSDPSSDLVFREGGFGSDAVEYRTAWQTQREIHEGVVGGDLPDTVWLLEHPPVFTAGKRTAPGDRPADPGGAPVIDVDRGGMITFHGPGQLVGYPIVRLPDHVKVVDYVRRVEEALIRICADLGLETARVPGRSGVWLKADAPVDDPVDDPVEGPVMEPFGGVTGGGPPRAERKVAAIGIRVSQGVTMHGFALNCDVDLGWYDRFVPCGIADAGVTSLSAELGRDVTVHDVLPSVRRHLTDLLGWAPYEATPDYEPRPEPGRAARVPVLGLPG